MLQTSWLNGNTQLLCQCTHLQYLYKRWINIIKLILSMHTQVLSVACLQELPARGCALRLHLPSCWPVEM